MRFTRYLKEEYLGITKGIYNPKESITYYVNPDSSDLKEIYKINSSIRFIADNKNKKLYIWNSDAANHSDGQLFLVKKGIINPKENRVAYDSNFLNGIAKISGWKLFTEARDCHDFFLYPDRQSVKDKMKHSWNWLKSYFINLDFIKEIKQGLE